MIEVRIAVGYIEKLLRTKLNNGKVISPQDISVVTPYEIPRRCIAQVSQRLNLNEITVSTVLDLFLFPFSDSTLWLLELNAY